MQIFKIAVLTLCCIVGRSCDQWDIWTVVFSPQNSATGYPKPLFDKTTGQIDAGVASYWREHYDLSHILKRDWHKGLGPKVAGKLHIVRIVLSPLDLAKSLL